MKASLSRDRMERMAAAVDVEITVDRSHAFEDLLDKADALPVSESIGGPPPNLLWGLANDRYPNSADDRRLAYRWLMAAYGHLIERPS